MSVALLIMINYNTGVDHHVINERLVPVFQALEDGILIKSVHAVTESNPKGNVLVRGGILYFAGDSPASNALCCVKNQV